MTPTSKPEPLSEEELADIYRKAWMQGYAAGKLDYSPGEPATPPAKPDEWIADEQARASSPPPLPRCPRCRESASGVCTQHNGVAPAPVGELDVDRWWQAMVSVASREGWAFEVDGTSWNVALDRIAAEYARLTGTSGRLRSDVRTILDFALGYLEVNSEPCRRDHHGGCQSHGYLGLEPSEECPQGAAQRAAARLTEKLERKD